MGDQEDPLVCGRSVRRATTLQPLEVFAEQLEADALSAMGGADADGMDADGWGEWNVVRHGFVGERASGGERGTDETDELPRLGGCIVDTQEEIIGDGMAVSVTEL